MIGFISAIAEVGICFLLLYGTVFIEEKLRKIDWIVCVGASIGIGILLSYCREFAYVSVAGLLASAFGTSLIVWILQREDIQTLLAISWTYYSITSLIQVMLVFWFAGYANVETGNVFGYYSPGIDSRDIYYLLSTVIALFGVWQIRKMIKRNGVIVADYGIILIIFDIILSLVFVRYSEFFKAMSDTMKSVEEIPLLTFLASALFVVALSFVFLKNKSIEKENAALQLCDEISKKRYEELVDVISKNNQLIHDVNNHLLLFQEYARMGDVESISNYIDEIRQDYIVGGRKKWTGNPTLDFILNQKKAEAERRGIVFTVESCMSVFVPINDSDICVLFGNLLDNAIEAASQISKGEKWIRTTIGQQREMLFIKIENNYGTETYLRDGEYETTKENKSAHGYGIKSAKRIVKKYDGRIVFEAEANVFQVKISFLASEELETEVKECDENERNETDTFEAMLQTKLNRIMPVFATVDFVWNILMPLDIFRLAESVVGTYGWVSYAFLIYCSVYEIWYLIRKSKRDENNRIGPVILLSAVIKASASMIMFVLKCL